MPDILDRIVADRLKDLDRRGPGLGCKLPPGRTRPLVPFLKEKGTILEIKRASPSKGDINAGLDPVALVNAYAASGARNVSVLTEERYFKGSLKDLVTVSSARHDLAFLRKDFLLREDEVEVSYRAGADAVLLIARILDTDLLRRMADKVLSLGMTAFIEVRDDADADKLAALVEDAGAGAGSGTGADAGGVGGSGASDHLLAGVNARDLGTFVIDPLVPAALFGKLGIPAVYESGIGSPGAAAYAARLGFKGILVGEGVARDSAKASGIVSAFIGTEADGTGQFWRTLAERRDGKIRVAESRYRPLIKICGLVRPEDALLAGRLGADLLGFVFAQSKRAASTMAVREARALLIGQARPAGVPLPLFIGVITELDSEVAKEALQLAREGTLDAIQWHGDTTLADLAALDAALTVGTPAFKAGRYAALRVGGTVDLDTYDLLRKSGEPRVLADARVEGLAGGTGAVVEPVLAAALAERSQVWLAGGLGPGTVGKAMDAYKPELVDASSRLEAEPGRKDHKLMEAYFKEIADHGF